MKKRRGGAVIETPRVGVYTAGVSIKSGGYERRPEKQPSRITPKWKAIVGAVLITAAVAVVTFGVVRAIQSMVPGDDDRGGTEVNPTVRIIDESNAEISSRTKLFVWRLEQEAGDYGVKIAKVVLPRGLVREVDVYFENREERYKMQLDRSPAVMMEDANRIMKYLDREGIKAEYVDVRVEGRGYYK